MEEKRRLLIFEAFLVGIVSRDGSCGRERKLKISMTGEKGRGPRPQFEVGRGEAGGEACIEEKETTKGGTVVRHWTVHPVPYFGSGGEEGRIGRGEREGERSTSTTGLDLEDRLRHPSHHLFKQGSLLSGG